MIWVDRSRREAYHNVVVVEELTLEELLSGQPASSVDLQQHSEQFGQQESDCVDVVGQSDVECACLTRT